MVAGSAVSDAVGTGGGGGGGGGGGATFFLQAPKARTSISATASINRFLRFNSSSKLSSSGPAATAPSRPKGAITSPGERNCDYIRRKKGLSTTYSYSA